MTNYISWLLLGMQKTKKTEYDWNDSFLYDSIIIVNFQTKFVIKLTVYISKLNFINQATVFMIKESFTSMVLWTISPVYYFGPYRI